MILDPFVKMWLSFKEKSGDTYKFTVRLVRENEIVNFPLVEVGSDFLDVAAQSWYTLKEALRSLPDLISTGVQLPYSTLSGLWTSPEPMKADKSHAPPIINPASYTAFDPLAWINATFFNTTDVEYIPEADPYTTIPDSIPDKWKEEPPEGGAVFMPDKSEYIEDEWVISQSDTYWDESFFQWWSQFFFAGCDINEYHILRTYIRSFPIALRPYSDDNTSPAQIYTCGARDGYDVYYRSVGNMSQWYTKRWITATLDADYYFPRIVGVGGGSPAGATGVGVALLGLIGMNGLGILSPKPIDDAIKLLK